MVDLHNHLLPGVDDGARSREESCAHLARWFASGVQAAVLTPHLLVPKLATSADLDAELTRLRSVFDELLAHTAGRSDIPELKLGQEVLAPDGEAMARVAEDRRVGLGGTDFILIEFGFAPTFDAASSIRAGLAVGRVPIIAHPERYVFAPGADSVATIEGWREMGALLQVNGGSLRGRYGDRIRSRAERLVRRGIVTIVASDHHGDSRPDDPLDTWLAVADLAGEGCARALLASRPARIFVGDVASFDGMRAAASRTG